MKPEALRALLAEATAGPWQGGTLDGDVGISGPPDSEYVTTEVRPLVIEYNDSLSRANAAFIVALRNHAEALLDVVSAAVEIARDGWVEGSWTRLTDALDRLEVTS